MVIKMKTLMELKDILTREKQRKKIIAVFLEENTGLYFTSDDVKDKTGIKCAGRLLNKKCRKVETPNAKGYVRIEIPRKPDDNYCSGEYYYGYRKEPDKMKRMDLDDKVTFWFGMVTMVLWTFIIAYTSAINKTTVWANVWFWVLFSVGMIMFIVYGVYIGRILEKYEGGLR